MKLYFCMALSLLLIGCGAFTSTSLTQANLDKVQEDMSPATVKSILGEPTDSRTEPIPVVGGTQTIYTYHTDTADVKIVFKNDLLKEKQGTFAR